MTERRPKLPITGNPEADLLLEDNPLALLIGMLLDQQIPMERAFSGPKTLLDRLGQLDATAIAASDLEEIEKAASAKPAIHRFPRAMAKRIHDLCRYLVDNYSGDPSLIWTTAKDANEVLERVRSLPGFGEEKAQIFVALLAKRMGVKPRGWKRAADPFSDDLPRSVADVGSPEALREVRLFKKQMKQAGKSKSDRN